MILSRSVLAFVLVVAARDLCLNAQTLSDVDVRFSAPEKTFCLGEPVTIEFRATNCSLASTTIDLGFDREEAFVFDIAEPDGSWSRVKAPQRDREGLSRVGRFSLRQGESYTQKIRLGVWYSFSKTGTYVITGNLVPAIDGDPAARTFTITITELDPAHLRATCERLAARALDPAGSGSFDAAVDLGLVKDPVSVPYLEKVVRAQKPAVRIAAILALGRIATLAATEVLLSVMNGANDEDRRRSYVLLLSIARTTQNREVRERLAGAGIR